MEKKTWYAHPVLLLCVFFLYLFCTSEVVAGPNIPIRVRVVQEMEDYGDTVLSCILMALSDFYSTHGHYNTWLVPTNCDSKGHVVGAAAALDLLRNVEVQASIGPMISGLASFLISLGQKSRVPIITFSATSPSLTSTYDYSQVEAIGTLVKTYGWREVVPIYVDNEFGEGIIPYLSDALEQINACIRYRSVMSPLATDDQIVAEFYRLKIMPTRVFIVHILSPLNSRLLIIAKQNGMMKRDYAWIVTDGITDELSSRNTSAIESIPGEIGVQPYVPNTKEINDFTTRHNRRYNPRGHDRDLDIFGLHAHDSAMALSIAGEKANPGNPKYQEANISRNSTNLKGFGISDAGPILIQAISYSIFKGLAGRFNLVDGQLQSPHYKIVKMAGPGAQYIGYWTKENRIVKDLNFTRSKSNLGLTKWAGDASSSPNGCVILTNGKTLRFGVSSKTCFEFVRVWDSWSSNNSTEVNGYRIDVFNTVMESLPTWNWKPKSSIKVEGCRIDVFNAVMASLPIGFLVWVLEHQINNYFRHHFWHQLGMTMWFAFSAFVFSHREKVVLT